LGGAGLGLSIARWIVEQHGGKIEARSEIGQGSQFTVVLPVAH
jgi:signal transduction histidine kinase